MRKIFFILFVSVQVLAIDAQPPYFPDAEWQVKKPEELKMNKKLLDSAVTVAIKQ